MARLSVVLGAAAVGAAIGAGAVTTLIRRPPPAVETVPTPVAPPTTLPPAPELAAAPSAQPAPAPPMPAEPAPAPVAQPALAPTPPTPPAPTPLAPTTLAPKPPGQDGPPDATFAAPPGLACGAKAARYEGEKGFQFFVTRIGRIQVDNPLRPLTPEVFEVLQVTIGGKMATAYGPDRDTLRRGGPPGALEGQLGGSIAWQPGLPILPDPLSIVSEDGKPLARLGFRECTEAPAVKTPPVSVRKEPKPRRPPAKPEAEAGRPEGAAAPARPPAKAAAPKVPPGFTLPQGAIAE